MAGWISLHRSIENHWLYEEDRKFSKFEAWIDLLLMVNHKDNKTVHGGKLMLIKRGQRITSLRKLSEKWQWSMTKVDRFLKLLEDDGMIVLKKDAQKTLITIVNYGVYQNEDLEKRHKKNTNETQTKNKKETNEKQTKTNNNDNKENNENNDNKENKENKKASNVFDLFQEYGFGVLNQYTSQDISNYLDEFENDSEEIVTAALKIALDRNKINWGYAKGILKDWLKSNLKSIDAVRAYEKQKLANFQSNFKGNYSNQSKEKTPEWLIKEKETKERAIKDNDPDFEEKKKQLEAEMQEWSETF